MGLHAVFHGSFDFFLPLLQCGGLVGLKLRLPVALHRELPVFIFQPVGGQKLFHPLKEGVFSRGILIGEVQLQLFAVELFLKAGMLQKRLDLAGKHEFTLSCVIIQRLDAKMIARTEQAFGVFIPDGKGKHTPQAAQHFLAPLLVAVQQHLGVAVRGKGVPGGDQLFPQGLVVVNFAVEHDHHRTVFVIHGLLAAL